MNESLIVLYFALLLSTIIFGNYYRFIQAYANTNLLQEPILDQSIGVNTTQTSKSASGTINWSQLPAIVGLSAIIGGGISALINYYSNAKQAKKQREVNVIQDLLSLYSLVIFDLDKLYDYGYIAFKRSDTLRIQEEKHNELQEILKPIDSSIQSKSYLLPHDVITKWMSLKRKYKNENQDEVNANATWLSAKEVIKTLRETLVTEYNDNILHDFEKITGRKLQKIDNDRE